MSTTPLSDPDTGDGIVTGDRVIPEEETTVGPAVTEPAEPTKRPLLRRSTSDKVIAGVAGGLARYLGVDPVIVRIALVVFALSGGAGVLLYLIAWIAIPEERPGELPAVASGLDHNKGIIILGAALLIAGGLLFAERLVPNFSAFMGPLVLVGLGAALILGARR